MIAEMWIFFAIGQLAKASGENVSTIRYWTKEGLLKVATTSKGGYQLYDQSMIAQAQKIRQLQTEKRMSIWEIKNMFLHTHPNIQPKMDLKNRSCKSQGAVRKCQSRGA